MSTLVPRLVELFTGFIFGATADSGIGAARATITRSTLIVLLGAYALPCATATPLTINFSSLSQPGSGYTSLGLVYAQQGFTFTDQVNVRNVPGGFLADQASSPDLPGLSPANTSLLEFYAGSTTVLAPVSNAAFALLSIDLAQYKVSQSTGTFSVQFDGRHPDNSTVSQIFTVDRFAGTPVLETFTFSGFTNLTSVSFTQGSGSNGTAYQFNNLVIDPGTTVPEPGTLLLIAVNLAGLIIGKKLLGRIWISRPLRRT